MGSEIFLPVRARRIGMKTLFRLTPDSSATRVSTSWIGSGSHGVKDSLEKTSGVL